MTSPAEDKKTIAVRRFLKANYHPSSDEERNDELLRRLSEAYASANKQAYRMLGVSILAALFFSIKIVGLRVDLVLLQQKVFELKYGTFVFCVTSQIAFVLAIVRLLDARTFDRYIKGVTEVVQQSGGLIEYQSFVGAHEWGSLQVFLTEQGIYRQSYKIFANLYRTILALISLGVYLCPIAEGIYFLWNFDELKVGKLDQFQWWSVASTTALAFGALCLAFGLYNEDNDQGV